MRFGRHQCDTKFSQRAFFPPTFRLASVFEQVFVWDGEVASLYPPSLTVRPFGGVQLPGSWVGCGIIPNRTGGKKIKKKKLKKHTQNLTSVQKKALQV